MSDPVLFADSRVYSHKVLKKAPDFGEQRELRCRLWRDSSTEAFPAQSRITE